MDLTPLDLAMDTVVGDRLAAWQLEQTGALVVTEGLVTTVQMMRYPADVGEFLTYRISISMQYRENSYTVPLVKNNKLAGLAPALRSALASARRDSRADHRAFSERRGERSTTRDFLRVGFGFFPTRDPQLRNLCRTNRQDRRRLCYQCRAEFARA